jgi:signal transduction histidine kinase/ketosteroid isomerase-like protein
VNLRSLVARHHQSYNDHDLDALSKVFDEHVEILVDGSALHGVAEALGYAAATFREFPHLRIHDARVVAESGDTIVAEHRILNGDPAGGPLRPQGSVCEIFRVRDERIVAYTCYYAPEGADREDVVHVPSRAEDSKMAEDQAALRRVATLVAEGVSQGELFAAVNEEVGWLVGADATSLMRFEPDDTVTLVAAWSAADVSFPIGAREPVDDELRSMRDDCRPMRVGPIELPQAGPFVEEARQLAIRSALGVPIVVDGRVWGVVFAASTREEPFHETTTARISGFTELVATAIANAESRAALTASRARVVAAADETRRRLERDLHDGAQQQIVSALLTLKLARNALAEHDASAAALVEESLRHAERANDGLRELVQGILPAALRSGGLRGGIKSLVRKIPVTVTVDVPAERLPEALETTAYFIVAEALTNVIKHSAATGAQVSAAVDDGLLRLEVSDDGRGGADASRGSGLLGLADRVAAAGGTIAIASPPGAGTTISVTLPVGVGRNELEPGH